METPSSSSASTVFRGWTLFFCGVCMGIADLVPGISGGTIAFILGFYHPLIESLKTINSTILLHLFKGQWRAIADQIAWKFLLTLLAGIAVAFVCFANFFHFILGHEVYRVYLYALFLGLIVASFVFCMRQVSVWSVWCIIGLVVGATSAYLLTDATLAPLAPVEETSYTAKMGLLNGWLVVCGAIAICALLLPGISGSYLLTVLGVYPIVIEALIDFLNGLKQGVIHQEAFVILFSLAIGIACGALSFARLLSWLMKKCPNIILSLLSGFMVGALRAVWPFWTIDYALNPFRLEKGPQLIPVHPFLPSWDNPMLWQAAGVTFAGFVLVFALEAIAKKKIIQFAGSSEFMYMEKKYEQF